MAVPTPERIARARERYAAGDPVSRILADAGISLGTLYLWLDGGPDDGSGTRLPPVPRRRVVLGKRRKPLSGSRVSLVNRLWRTAERQVRDIEDRLRLNQQEADERERDARTLAVLVKTVRELRMLKNDEEQPAEDDHAPADIDELRRDLARRIDAIVGRRSDGVSG